MRDFPRSNREQRVSEVTRVESEKQSRAVSVFAVVLCAVFVIGAIVITSLLWSSEKTVMAPGPPGDTQSIPTQLS